MKTAKGIGAWHNQFSTRPWAECAERAQRARLDYVIVKYGLRGAETAYEAAGVPWATEVYAYARRPEADGNMLADAVDNGACFAVINAEEGPGGWGPDLGTQPAMNRLIDTFRGRHTGVALYACLDTRGDRLNHPYQRVALARCSGVMPMVYPGAFYPHRPTDYIFAAFDDCLKGKDFGATPVYPALQSYEWQWPKNSGYICHLGDSGIAVQAELASGYPGYSFYTIHHATDAEWEVVCNLKPQPKPDQAAKEKCELAIYRGSKPLIHLATDGEWAALHAKLHEMKVEPA